MKLINKSKSNWEWLIMRETMMLQVKGLLMMKIWNLIETRLFLRIMEKIDYNMIWLYMNYTHTIIQCYCFNKLIFKIFQFKNNFQSWKYGRCNAFEVRLRLPSKSKYLKLSTKWWLYRLIKSLTKSLGSEKTRARKEKIIWRCI
jgi:hypothetical protein